MFKYILKRILIFIPTLFVISLVAFALSKFAPGDPVELLLKGQDSSQGQEASTQRYEEVAERLGLNLPSFYFAVSTAAYPDTLHYVVKKSEQEVLNNFIAQYGNWDMISQYYLSLKALERQAYKLPSDSTNFESKRTLNKNTKDLLIHEKDNKITKLIDEMQQAVADTTSAAQLAGLVTTVANNYNNIKAKATVSNMYIPSLKWYGVNNQYHRWITNFFAGDFGLSYLDSRPVGNKIWDALRWTLIINFFSILIAYLIAIPIGVTTSIRKDTTYDRITTTVLFILYSLPTFWIGTILIVFFTTPEYGNALDIFPTGGVTSLSKDAPFMARTMDILYHLLLPIFCVTYGSFAFISRQMRGGMLSVIRQDYVRTAKAKGLAPNNIIWKHAFRNSLFPIITLFAYIFPAAIAGSVTIEVIYSIPGMGKLIIDSIFARDWPVVYTVLMFAAILTMVGNLVADMLYAVADPRVSYAK